jgi:choline dehydrogenase-like flavoprotein
MSAATCDVLVVGGGPAGTSAALALADAERPVVLLDAGTRAPSMPPPGAYLDLRRSDPAQWRWQLGAGFEAFAVQGAVSPKLRVPGFASMFDGFATANRVHAEGFQLVGALAAGGLANAWGCGVARFHGEDLGPLADVAPALDASYARVAQRMGLSGASDDALSAYFGLDALADPALPLDPLHAALWERSRRRGTPAGFALGRARVAVLSRPRDGRPACDLRGMCLWGCEQRSTWSAALDVVRLRRLPHARVESGVLVTALWRDGDAWRVEALHGGQPVAWRARRVLLAAGTVASTRLALAAMQDPPRSVRLQSNPMGAFLLLQPAMLGRRHAAGFGLAQLSYVLEQAAGAGQGPVFGNLFSTAGLPMAEFLRYLPVGRRSGLPLLRALLPAAVVGNAFLPGSLSRHEASLRNDGSLEIRGGSDATLASAHAATAQRLRIAFRRLGAWMLPGSYVPGAPGADIHYAGTLPVSRAPRAHECDLQGEIAGLPGVYAIDGASLPVLPAKAHTLTIVANADRVARGLPPAD